MEKEPRTRKRQYQENNHKDHDHDPNHKNAHEHHGHDHGNGSDHDDHDHGNGHDHHGHTDFLIRFYASLVATVPILALSPMIQDWFNFELDFPGREIVLFALAAFVYLYGGWPFLKGFKDEIADKNPGMMTLVAMAISVAFFYSTATLLGLEGDDFFWELATLVVIMLIGHHIEMRSIQRASGALDELAKLMPSSARRIRDETFEEVPIAALELDDVILVRPGERIAADGIVIEGESHVDESMLTGESVPVRKKKADQAVGGSVNKEGSLRIRVENTGEEAYLHKVITLVKEARASKSRTQNLADRAARILTFGALGAGILTLSVWLHIQDDPTFAIARMATVLVIACPHALGLATPLVVANSTTLSAQRGLIIRNRTAFEQARKVDLVYFDKTGTLTEGVFTVQSVKTLADVGKDDVIRLAAAVERHSEHPIAQGIVEYAERSGGKIPQAEGFAAEKGVGVKATVEDDDIAVVSPARFQKLGFSLEEENLDATATHVYVLKNDRPVGIVSLGDTVRKNAKAAVEKLQKRGIEVRMLTGDNERVAKVVAEKLDLDGYESEVLPEEKQEFVRRLQNENRHVAMTGDGVNDAPALAAADLGIAVGSGTDVAAETADVILVKSDPEDVAAVIAFGRSTFRKMVENLIWATGYNIVAIPLAAGLLYPLGILVSPAMGAVLMSLSTVIVAINAKRLSFR